MALSSSGCWPSPPTGIGNTHPLVVGSPSPQSSGQLARITVTRFLESEMVLRSPLSSTHTLNSWGNDIQVRALLKKPTMKSSSNGFRELFKCWDWILPKVQDTYNDGGMLVLKTCGSGRQTNMQTIIYCIKVDTLIPHMLTAYITSHEQFGLILPYMLGKFFEK